MFRFGKKAEKGGQIKEKRTLSASVTGIVQVLPIPYVNPGPCAVFELPP